MACLAAWTAVIQFGRIVQRLGLVAFKEKKKPTIVLEALCDYNLWFWHGAYGFAGSLNDLNILASSPLLESMLDGSFEELEQQSGVVPYTIKDSTFDKVFLLADGIYPPYARFVKTLNEPVTNRQKRYATWQESARKDIERAFGVLQGQYKFIANPIQKLDLDEIGVRVGTCLILHNMGVSDRIMDNEVRAVYKPSAYVGDGTNIDEMAEISRAGRSRDAPPVGARHLNNDTQLMVRKRRWCETTDTREHGRLHEAILNTFKDT